MRLYLRVWRLFFTLELGRAHREDEVVEVESETQVGPRIVGFAPNPTAEDGDADGLGR